MALTECDQCRNMLDEGCQRMRRESDDPAWCEVCNEPVNDEYLRQYLDEEDDGAW